MHSDNPNKLPHKYIIFEHQIPFYVPGFSNSDHRNGLIQTPFETDCQTWYREFVDNVVKSIGKQFLPVCRMSDGEFLLLFGRQPLSPRRKFKDVLKHKLRDFKRFIFQGSDFVAATLPGVSSGKYTKNEVLELRNQLKSNLKYLSEKGALAMHLSYHARPFQEEYFPVLKTFFNEYRFSFTSRNYVPFYFVYALLRGKDKGLILKDRRILVFHSATGEKRGRIESTLLQGEVVKEIRWHQISSSRSMLEKITLEEDEIGRYDLALMGAGVGKINLLPQLEKLKIPVIDAGYLFEVWADETNALKRPYLIPD